MNKVTFTCSSNVILRDACYLRFFASAVNYVLGIPQRVLGSRSVGTTKKAGVGQVGSAAFFRASPNSNYTESLKQASD